MKNNLIIAVLFVALAFSCEPAKEKMVTQSGVEVVFEKKRSTGREMVEGDYVFFNMKYTTDTDSVLFDTDERGGAVPIHYNALQWHASGLVYEAFIQCKEGDSISFNLPAMDLFEKTFRTQMPDGVDSATTIKFYAGVEKIRTKEELDAEIIKEAEAQLGKDIEIIDQHLADNGIEAISTESGLRYVITEPGNGDNAIDGQNITVHYNGTLLDGTKFDSSYDRSQPFTFVLGRGGVIKGWDEGFTLLNKGAKATLYIPSPLAYGARARSEVIKENSILKFEVELIDVQ